MGDKELELYALEWAGRIVENIPQIDWADEGDVQKKILPLVQAAMDAASAEMRERCADRLQQQHAILTGLGVSSEVLRWLNMTAVPILRALPLNLNTPTNQEK